MFRAVPVRPVVTHFVTRCLLSIALLAGCVRPGSSSGDSAAATTPPASSAVTTTSEWRPLLRNGPGLAADWRGYKSDHIPAGWTLADGILTKEGESDDIVTRDEFGDFELAFEWKIAPRGNAGVFYRATEEYDKVYWSAPEYQLLDDPGHPDGRNRLTSAGAAYALYPSPAGVVRPADEWNESRIVVSAAHVEHWLNGKKLLEYELGSPDWEAKVKAAKFADYPNYGRARRGRIGIQGDHNGTLQLREVRIREIR